MSQFLPEILSKVHLSTRILNFGVYKSPSPASNFGAIFIVLKFFARDSIPINPSTLRFPKFPTVFAQRAAKWTPLSKKRQFLTHFWAPLPPGGSDPPEEAYSFFSARELRNAP